MSTTVIVLEALGIAGAAIGMALAQSPPEDVRAWWDRHDWLRRLITGRPDDAEHRDYGGLSILPWRRREPPDEQ